MAQYARPTSDISVGSWTDEGSVDNDGNLYTSMDEVTSDNDDSYIQGTLGAGTAVVKLGAVTDPVSSSGHVWHLLWRSIGSGAGEKMDFYLYQGASTLIASAINQSNRSGTYVDINVTLSAAQADAITDYSDLRIWIVEDTIGSGEYVRVTQCYLEVPDAPVAPNEVNVSDVVTVSESVDAEIVTPTARLIRSGDMGELGTLVETSTGVKYAILGDGSYGGVYVYKNIDTTPTLMDSDTAATIFGGDGARKIHAAIDGDDNIHIVAACTADQTRDIAYCIYDTGTDTLGTWEEAGSYTDGVPTPATAFPDCWISLDSNGKPWVVYVDMVGSYAQIRCVDKTGAGWSSPETISDNAAAHYNIPRISHCPNDDIEAVYHISVGNDIAYKRRNGSWGAESTYSVTASNYYGIGSGITCTTGDTVYRYFCHESGGNNVMENNVDTGYDAHTSYRDTFPTLVGTTRYIMFLNTSAEIQLLSNDGGGWISEGVLKDATMKRSIPAYAYNFYNVSGEIIYIYSDDVNIYYDTFPIEISTKSVSISDALEISDIVTVSISTPQILISDTIEITDTPTVSIQGPPTRQPQITDTLEITDTPTLDVSDPQVIITDTIEVSDAPTASIQGPPIRTISISDTLEVSDTPNVQVSTPQVSITDTLEITDTPIVAIEGLAPWEASTSDTIEITDTPIASIQGPSPRLVSTTDTIEIADTSAFYVLVSLVVSDALEITDTPVVAIEGVAPWEASTSDTIEITDTPTLNIQGPPVREPQLSDTIEISDTVTPLITVLMFTITDTIEISDALNWIVPSEDVRYINIADTIEISDTPNATVSTPLVSVTDAIDISDTLFVNISNPQISITDAIEITDTLSAQIPSIDLSLVISDTVLLSDQVTTTVSTPQFVITDTILISEVLSVSPVVLGVSGDIIVSDISYMNVLLADSMNQNVNLLDEAYYDVIIQDFVNK